jgi:hypothetical protein
MLLTIGGPKLAAGLVSSVCRVLDALDSVSISTFDIFGD